MVAFRAKSCIIYFLTSLYMWLDLIDSVYRQGICESIAISSDDDDDKRKYVGYWMAYKTINIIPTLFVASYITLDLSYRTIVSFIGMMTACKNKKGEENMKCIICAVDDDYEIVYSHCDVMYVLDLLHNKDEEKTEGAKNMKIFTNIFKKMSHLNESTGKISEINTDILERQRSSGKNEETQKIAEKKKKDSKLKKILRERVYDWNPYFKFSSRFINTQIVAYVTLFHFTLFILYELVYWDIFFQSNLEVFDLNNLANLTIADLLCAWGDELCIPELAWPLPIPPKIVKFGKEFIPSLNALLLTPFFGALLICVVQVFIGMRDTKKFDLFI